MNIKFELNKYNCSLLIDFVLNRFMEIDLCFCVYIFVFIYIYIYIGLYSVYPIIFILNIYPYLTYFIPNF